MTRILFNKEKKQELLDEMESFMDDFEDIMKSTSELKARRLRFDPLLFFLWRLHGN